MRYGLLFLIALVLQSSVFSQRKSIWSTFFRVVDAREHGGKKFRIEAAVKVSPIDKDASAALWARVDRTDNKKGFFYNMWDKPIKSLTWNTYVINGKIDKGAKQLVFGGISYKKGISYFDDFKFFIESSEGRMEQINLINEGFEEDSLRAKSSWYFDRGFTKHDITLTTQEFHSGNKSCKVDGSKIVDTTLGNNETAGKYAQVNGIDIYYEEYGKGAPLLLLHGNSSSISLFEKQVAHFSKYFHVIAVDTRGQGKSSEDGRLYTYDLFADDMNALLNYLKLDSVNIVGWSDGGNTGLIMAMKYPSKVKKLVTMGANVFIDKTVVDNWVFKALRKEQKELESDTTFYGRNRLKLITLLLTEPKHSFTELKDIKCPVLVVAGEKDVVKENHTKSISASISKSKLYIAPKETHYFPSENPVLFNAKVIEFLSD